MQVGLIPLIAVVVVFSVDGLTHLLLFQVKRCQSVAIASNTSELILFLVAVAVVLAVAVVAGGELAELARLKLSSG